MKRAINRAFPLIQRSLSLKLYFLLLSFLSLLPVFLFFAVNFCKVLKGLPHYLTFAL
ncbi:hypothetical protein [Wolbachia endosymbiont (group A) of Lasioglossum fulvicorne]|uniref:hypothetical protein n=1 Tax=Wolbachia endosymbiont (group A) of Lasioglossum fulvicorne TaxID=3066201 RepID=UPI00397E17EF